MLVHLGQSVSSVQGVELERVIRSDDVVCQHILFDQRVDRDMRFDMCCCDCVCLVLQQGRVK